MSLHGMKIENIEQIYKGDGVTTCKWCGGTGMMHTFSNDGYFYSDAPCICELGREIMNKELGKKRRPKMKLITRDTSKEEEEILLAFLEQEVDGIHLKVVDKYENIWTILVVNPHGLRRFCGLPDGFSTDEKGRIKLDES